MNTLKLNFWKFLNDFLEKNPLEVIRSENTNNFYEFKNGNWYHLKFKQRYIAVHVEFNDDFQLNQLRHSFSVGESKDLLIATIPQGIRLYLCDEESINKTYEWIWNFNIDDTDLTFGRFYPDIGSMGAIVITKNMTKFFKVESTSFVEVTTNVDVLNRICPDAWKIEIYRLKKEPRQVLMKKSNSDICVFEFDVNYNIRLVEKISFDKKPEISENDKIFFANLSGHEDWMDMIIFNSKGIFVFEYRNAPNGIYNLINYNPMFSLEKGWTEKHTESVHFVDFNDDGFDDIIFTGPGGIEILSYDAYRNIWKSLLYTKDIPVVKRHTKVSHIIYPEYELASYFIIFTYHAGTIKVANIVREPAEVMKLEPINKRYESSLNDTRNVFEKVKKDDKANRSRLYLRDQINNLLSESGTINPQTGKPYFTLPLVGKSDSMIKFHLVYDGSSNQNGLSGLGWSAPQSFIISDYGDGNFEEDESYILVVNDVPHVLIYLPENSTEDFFYFKLEKSDNHFVSEKFLAVLYPTSSLWYIDYGTGHKQYFGSYGEFEYGSVVTDVSWKNWRGLGIDEDSTIERANMWYLAASQFKGITTFYQYENIRTFTLNGKDSYVAGVFLKKIHNIYDEIRFTYIKNKDTNEPFYMSSYTYETKTTTQTIHFKYSSAGDYFLFTRIEQESDYRKEPVMIFKYCQPVKGKYVLHRIILPSGTKIIYNYTLLGTSTPINGQMSPKIIVSDDYNVSYGPGFTLISYLDRNLKMVILRMFDNEMSKEIYPSLKDTKTSWPPLGPDAIGYEIFLCETLLAVVIYIPRRKIIYLFGRRIDGSWMSPPPSYIYSQETTVLRGSNYLLISDPHHINIIVLEWLTTEGIWKKIAIDIDYGKLRAVAAYGNKFLVYNDRSIFLGYKDLNDSGSWKLQKLVDNPGYLSDTIIVLKKFDLKYDFYKALLGFFRNNVLQMRHNLIILSTLMIKNHKDFVTNIIMYTIGRNNQIVNDEYTTVPQDNFMNLESEPVSNSDGDLFTLKYTYIRGKFKIILGSFESPSGKTRSQLSQEVFKQMNTPAKRFLLDLKNYYVHLRGQTIECRNVQFTFGGMKWHRSEIARNTFYKDSQSVVLGNRFTVNKTNAQSTIKLYDATKKTILFDFGVIDIEKVQINYPIYIASQQKGKSVTVIEFKDNKDTQISVTKLPESEVLSPFGSTHSLVTHETDTQGKKILSIRPMYNIRRFLPDFVITSVGTIILESNGTSKKRITGYEYEEKYARLITNVIRFSQVTVVPGNEKKSFGYFTITAKSVEFFNGDNQLVKRIQKDLKRKSEKTDNINENKKETSLYCRDNHYEIADFAPFSQSSNMSSFIGFENYESPSENWNFNQSVVTNGRFSLTGKNYLQLDDGNSLNGIFKPKFQDRQFVASCWIRTTTEMIPRLGNIVPYLRAAILTQESNEIFTFLSDVKYQIGDWSYLEVSFDLEFIKLTLETLNQNKSADLQVEIRVSSMPNVSLDIDHIRFSPLSNIFDVNIYDEDINRIVAIIKSNGAITRQFYDKYQVKIADINESNQIEEFITYTKNWQNKGHFQNPASLIKLIPENGFYEGFSPINFCGRWTLTNLHSWNISPSVLEHYMSHRSELSLNCEDIDKDSHGVRFLYSIADNSSIVVFNIIELKVANEQAEISLLDDSSAIQVVPVEGEILLVNEGNRTIVWIDGNLCIDQHSSYSKQLEFVVEGEIKIQQMMLFSRSQVQVTYKNSLGEEIQHISLASDTTAILREKLYDSLGRQRITVQPVEIARGRNQSLVAYLESFVSNDDPNSLESVWKTGKLKGEVQEIVGHEFAFSEVVYDKNPLNIETRIGIPGKEFSANGLYAQRFSSTTANKFLQREYPLNNNFTYKVQIDAFGNEKISVFNDRELKVAIYLNTINEIDVFSTFDYNEMDLIIKCRPPLFYFKYGIFERKSMDLTGFSDNMPTEHPLEIRIEYNANGSPIRKLSPDMGPLENVYDDKDRLRFIIQYLRSNPRTIESIAYFLYDSLERLIGTGTMNPPFHKDNLLALNISEENADEFQRFYYSDRERDPAFRGRILRTITMNNNEAFYEESINDFKDNSISKRYLFPNESEKPQILSINRRYEGGLLKEIIYPASMFGEIFRVSYEYDRLGRMISVGVPGQTNRFLSITYNANNQVIAESFLPLHKNNFVRSYKYNEPGYLIEIKDAFLCEEISYTDEGYGKHNFGDDTVVRIKFIAKWHQYHCGTTIGLRENSFENDEIPFLASKRCFHELQREGYLNKNDQQIRVFDPSQSSTLSAACTNETMKIRVKQVLGKYGFPEEFGFRFEYGPYMKLKKAKYFIGSLPTEPATPHSGIFARNIRNISENKSKKIWNLLFSSGYIAQDKYGNMKPGKMFVRENLHQDLYAVNPYLAQFAPFIEKLLLKQFTNRLTEVPLSEVEKIFVEEFPNKTANAETIHAMLLDREYFSNPISSNLIDVFKEFKPQLPEIVGIIQKYIIMERAEFDVDSNEIDPNGNHQKFQVGFQSYTLNYEQNSNRLTDVSITQYNGTIMSLPVQHDNRGNVIKAFHKDIDLMEYHPISNRLQNVKMTNGNNIIFQYDSKGERVLKRVIDQYKQIKSEMHYLRDDNGRTLVERKLTFIAKNQKPDVLVTVYIYGPKSLIGFVRRDQFYSVFTDHQGSVRLVVKDDEVVAAYDYMPYGNLLRIYGNNPDAHILYRYTGQEWDPDLHLYNYHARLYDPSIGRFYQIDPMTQYFSPYKYAGNSPVSMVDPSGSLAFPFLLAIFGFTFLGAYLGGAESNNDYNILKWDWSDRNTQLAIFVGGLTGALLPIGLSGSLAALSMISISTIKAATITTTIGLFTTYMSMSASSGSWNPGNWDYASPKTWYAAFEGFSVGVGILSGFHGAYSKFISLSRRGKYIFGSAVIIYGGQSFIMGGVKTNWNTESPKFWYSSLIGFSSAPDLPLFTRSTFQFLRKNTKIVFLELWHMKNLTLKLIKELQIGHFSTQLIVKLGLSFLAAIGTGVKIALTSFSFIVTLSIFINLLMGNLQNWNLKQFSTYYDLLTALKLTANVMAASKETLLAIKPSLKTLTKHAHTTVSRISHSFAKAVTEIQISSKKKNNNNNNNIHKNALSQVIVLTVSSELAFLVKFTNISLLYTHNHYTNPLIFKDSKDDDLNGSIGSIKFQEDNSSIQTIVESLKNLENELLKFYESKLLQENIDQWKVKGDMPQTLFDEEIIIKWKRILTEIINSNNLKIDRNYILQTFLKENFESKQVSPQYVKKLSELKLIEAKLTETHWDFQQQNEYLAQKTYLETAIKNIQWRKHISFANQTEILANVLWKKLKVHINDLVKWEVSNRAEPSTIMLSMLANDSHTKYYPNPNAYESSQDLMFLESYKLKDIPQLTGFEKCYTCIKATTKTRTKIRDIVWLAMLNEKFITKESMKDYDKEEVTLFTKKIKRSINIESPRMGVGNKWSHANPKLLEINNEPLFNSKWINASSENSVNLLQFGDEYFSQLASNKSLFLADVLLAKCGKRKMFKRSNVSYKLDYLKKQELVCKLMDLYEEFLKKSAKAFRIDIDLRNESNAYELYEEVVSVVNRRRFEEVSDLILKFTLNTFSDRSSKFPNIADSPSHRQLEIFAARSCLTSEIDEILIKINY